MYVESLKISGFTSFKDVRWEPERLNVLIGPNGSGKSNLLRALELIRASAAGNLRDFVLSNGGLPRLLWGESAQQMDFEIETGIAPDGPPAGQPFYHFTLVPVPQSASFRVLSETLEGETVLQGDNALARNPAMALPETETALSMVSPFWTDPMLYLSQQRLRAWTIYRDRRVDEHAEIRRPAVVREEKRISPDGQNLISLLKTLYRGDFKDAIDHGMSAAFPDDFGKLLFRPTEPDRVQMYVRRRHGSREDSAADLSDGTIRFLLLLAILATRTQVILSTHSPQMLDAFGETLPATTIFNWTGDHTELKTIGGNDLRKWVEEYSLGRFIFSGEAAAVL